MENYLVFIIPILVVFSAMITKFVIHGFKHEWDINYITAYGHMPSGHTALVVSLIISLWYYQDPSDPSFAVAIILAFVVIYDAVRLRRHVGEHSQYLNRIVKTLNLSLKDYPRLKERVGHYGNEVFAGGIFGFFVTLFFIWVFNGVI